MRALGAAFGRATTGDLGSTGTGFTADLLTSATTTGGSAWALSQVLRRTSGADPAWLRGTADALLAADRADPVLWAMYAPVDSPVATTALGHHDRGGAWDPLTGVLHAMADQPALALSWLGAPDRYAYLLQERPWHSDRGDGLGRAVEAATVAGRAGEPLAAADLASRVLHTLGTVERSRLDGELRGLHDSVGLVVGEYARDVDFAVHDSGLPGASPGTSSTGVGALEQYGDTRPGALVDADAVRRLLGTIGGDERAVVAVALGVRRLDEARVAHAVGVDAAGGGGVAATLTALERSAALEGWVTDGITEGRLAQARADDARVALVLHALTAPVALVPGGSGLAGVATGFALDQARSAVEGVLATDHAGRALEEANDLVGTRREQLVAATAQQLLDAGALDDTDLHHWPRDADGVPVALADMSPDQRREWSAWRHGGVGTALDGAVADAWVRRLDVYGRP